VEHFIIDFQTWQISYPVCRTHYWPGGKSVLFAARHIKQVQWENSKVVVDLTIQAIKHSIDFDAWDYIIPEGDKAESQQHHFHLSRLPLIVMLEYACLHKINHYADADL
jgi:hypothetical protein